MGLLASRSVSAQETPIKTLCEYSSIRVIHGKCITDPVKIGNSKHRIIVSTNTCETQNGSVFSAKGNQLIFIDSEKIQHNQFGGIGWKHGSQVSKNTIVQLTGSYSTDSFGKHIFYATDLIIPPLNYETFSLFTIRSLVRLYVNRILFDLGQSGGLLISLLSGNKDYLENGLAQKFKDTGLSHILALSGMHLSLFSYIAIQIGSRLGGKKVSIRSSLFAMLFFLWFAGESPSLIRAFLLSILSIVSARSGESVNLLKLLALTFLIQLLIRPQDIRSIGGILSYLALIGIIFLTDRPQKIIDSYIPSWITSTFLASFGAICATAPFQIFTFKMIPLAALPATLIVSPLCLLFISTGIVHVFLSLFIPSSILVTKYVLNLLYTLINQILSYFSLFPVIHFDYLPVALLSAIMIPFVAILVIMMTTFILSRRAPNAAFARL